MTSTQTDPTTESGASVVQAGADGSGSDGRSPAVNGSGYVATRKSWIVFAVTLLVVVGSTVGLFLPLVPEAIGILACVLMLGLIFLRLPVAIAMIVPSLLGMYALRGPQLVEGALTDVPFASTASWSLSVIPMFVLMGLLLWRAGLTTSLYDAGKQWLGWLPGGLAVGTNVAGAGLASVSGSTSATTYAIARIGIPEMLKAGYHKRMAIGAVITAGLPGQLIPPSILLVIYAGIAEVPVGPQLLAGVMPGLMVAVLFSIAIVLMVQLIPGMVDKEAEKAAAIRTSWSDRFLSLTKVWPVPLIIGLIVWGMFSGTFTATEAGASAALAALVISLIWKAKDGPFRAVSQAAIGSVAAVGAIFLTLVGVDMLSRMLTLTGISTGFVDVVQSMDLNRIEFLLIMVVVYLLLGTFMEALPMMVLTVPVLLPTLAALDISLIWFGVFVVFMGEIAVVSPPVGMLAFIIHTIAQEPEVNLGQRITIGDVFMALVWFLPMAVIVTLLLIFFPEIATWLPDAASGGGG